MGVERINKVVKSPAAQALAACEGDIPENTASLERVPVTIRFEMA